MIFVHHLYVHLHTVLNALLNLWDLINVNLINSIINLKMKCKIEVQVSCLFKDSVLIFWMKRNFVLLVKDGMTKTGSSYLVFIYGFQVL
jgi:hypothetical protein